MTATMTNGKPQRKQLSDQLDRMDELMERQDSILDALSEGLNAAVADAARTGVKEAVSGAVMELLTNIDLRAALHRATAPPAEAKPSFWQRIKFRVQRATANVKEVALAAGCFVASKVIAVKSAAFGATSPVWLVWRLRNAALIGLGVGLAMAGVSYAANHGVAAALSGIGAATTAVAVHCSLWVRRMVRAVQTT